MYRAKDMENTHFGFEVGRKYKVFARKKDKDTGIVERLRIYLGEGGENKVFLMFKTIDTNVTECFLKIDILNKEYRMIEI